MTPSHIQGAAFSPASRIGGGVVPPGPAVTQFAKAGASVAPTASGYLAGDALRLSDCPLQLAGCFGSRRFSQFGAVAGSSSQSADANDQNGFVLDAPTTPAALTECATFETSAGGFQ